MTYKVEVELVQGYETMAIELYSKLTEGLVDRGIVKIKEKIDNPTQLEEK